jgi:hypothetical protein
MPKQATRDNNRTSDRRRDGAARIKFGGDFCNNLKIIDGCGLIGNKSNSFVLVSQVRALSTMVKERPQHFTLPTCGSQTHALK